MIFLFIQSYLVCNNTVVNYGIRLGEDGYFEAQMLNFAQTANRIRNVQISTLASIWQNPC
jgi:hypothetical protein